MSCAAITGRVSCTSEILGRHLVDKSSNWKKWGKDWREKTARTATWGVVWRQKTDGILGPNGITPGERMMGTCMLRRRSMKRKGKVCAFIRSLSVPLRTKLKF